MSTVAHRIAVLEEEAVRRRRALDPTALLVKAQDALADGSATLEQLALVESDAIAGLRLGLPAYGVLMAARRSAGMVGMDVMAALAFRPDEQLPGEVACELELTWAIANSGARTVRRKEAGQRFRVEQVRCAAILAVVLGDKEALPARREVWSRSAGGWVHPGAANAGLDIHALCWTDFKFFCEGYFDVDDQECGDPLDPYTVETWDFEGNSMVLFREVLRHIRLWERDL